jgi:hypothetical protein
MGVDAVDIETGKGRVRWLAKGNAVGQGQFIAWLFDLAG